MGVEYRHYLIPRPNDYLPTADRLLTLMEALRNNAWICTPESPAFARMVFQGHGHHEFAKSTGAYAQTPKGYSELPIPTTEKLLTSRLADDLILCWPVDNLADAELHYPFTKNQWDASETYYELQLHCSPNYVNQMTEQIDPFPDPLTCSKCSYGLQFYASKDIFYTGRIHHICPKCGNKIDVSSMTAIIRGGWTRNERKVQGGATYRFALTIDCGKCLPSNTDDNHLQSKLVGLCKKIFGCNLYEVGTYY